jgi:hypothetical protein
MNSRVRSIAMASRVSTLCVGCITENRYGLRVDGPDTSALTPPMYRSHTPPESTIEVTVPADPDDD